MRAASPSSPLRRAQAWAARTSPNRSVIRATQLFTASVHRRGSGAPRDPPTREGGGPGGGGPPPPAEPLGDRGAPAVHGVGPPAGVEVLEERRDVDGVAPGDGPRLVP